MFLEMSFQSKELKKMTKVNVILPDEREAAGEPCTVLWLFHGLHGDHTSWMRQSGIEKYAKEHRIAVVMRIVAGTRIRRTEPTIFPLSQGSFPPFAARPFRGSARSGNITWWAAFPWVATER